MSAPGKWGRRDVPHKGWHCLEVEDLGEPSAICEMCEIQPIRFAHTMKHEAWPVALRCGCVCSGVMESDCEAARGRERALRNRTGRRQRWLSRRWRVSRAGNEFLNTGPFNIVVFKRGGGWAWRVKASGADTSTGWQQREATEVSRTPCPSADAAKLAAFDAMAAWQARAAAYEKRAGSMTAGPSTHFQSPPGTIQNPSLKGQDDGNRTSSFYHHPD